MVQYDREKWTFDCEPTLSDSQVLDFCRTGYLVLDGVVDAATNQKALDYLNGDRAANPSFMPEGWTEADFERVRGSHEPGTIMLEEWYIQNVLLNGAAAGALRSLLGKSVGMPVVVSKHSTACPAPAQEWHHDADCVFGPELYFVEAFYYPQDTPAELGPTEVAPGTHYQRTQRETHEEGVLTSASAGSIVFHHQSILHRRGASTATGTRHMLKYNYWRTAPPVRDWIVEDEFDFHTAHYGGHGQYQYCTHLFYWLCGKGEAFRIMGGQAWPWWSPNQIRRAYGYGLSAGYLPDWDSDSAGLYTPWIGKDGV